MESEFMQKTLEAIHKKTGYDLDAGQLLDLLETYEDHSDKKLRASLNKMVKGERGGEDVETTAAIEEMEIVLAARTAF